MYIKKEICYINKYRLLNIDNRAYISKSDIE